MKIDKLKIGTKLMWDPKANNPVTKKKILYPAMVLDQHLDLDCVRILTGGSTNFMGPIETSLRLPTDKELEELTWPEIPAKYWS